MKPLQAVLVFTFAQLAGLVQAQPEAPGFEIERREWQAPIPPGSRLEVTNGFGDVRARFGGYADVVEVQAVIQHLAADGPRLEVVLEAGARGVTVQVGERLEEAGGLSIHRRLGQRKRVDLVLFVPRGVALVAATADGLIDARGLRGDLQARTESGEILARAIHGDLDLESVSGAVVAAPEPLDRTATQRLASQSGDITVYLREQSHFGCRLETEGWISSDVSVEFEAEPRPVRLKQARAVVGKGTTPLVMSSTSGHLRLMLKPAAAEARANTAAPAAPSTPGHLSAETKCRMRLTVQGGPLVLEAGDSGPEWRGSSEGWQWSEHTDAGVRVLAVSRPPTSELSGRPPGRLALPSRCALEVFSRHDELEARGQWQESLDLSTETGDIRLYLDSSAGANVELATSGEITVDFSATIHYVHHRETTKIGQMVRGSGTPGIRLSSQAGALWVLRSPN